MCEKLCLSCIAAFHVGYRHSRVHFFLILWEAWNIDSENLVNLHEMSISLPFFFFFLSFTSGCLPIPSTICFWFWLFWPLLRLSFHAQLFFIRNIWTKYIVTKKPYSIVGIIILGKFYILEIIIVTQNPKVNFKLVWV